MVSKKANQWVERNEKRKMVLINLTQPMTALQLSTRTGFTLDQCSLVLQQLVLCGFVKCLNPMAKRSRLYWLTQRGITFQRQLRKDKGLPILTGNLPDIDWKLYGWVCYSHRMAIVKTLIYPMSPAEIKRMARQRNPNLKMSANNVRDVIKLFLKKDIVQPVKVRKKTHLRYELTEIGKKLKELLS